eukprot:TRINITY_DN81247_c0_g1_i1.p3 TRINITY_DN81247_c0_g1~~TRINITY_DN81247_c0_g1_i1.p3  ORF type:complete len:114 (-),score=29.25 TRINITY_DN81247_c0_g1_i1:442-783(-)
MADLEVVQNSLDAKRQEYKKMHLPVTLKAEVKKQSDCEDDDVALTMLLQRLGRIESEFCSIRAQPWDMKGVLKDLTESGARMQEKGEEEFIAAQSCGNVLCKKCADTRPLRQT